MQDRPEANRDIETVENESETVVKTDLVRGRGKATVMTRQALTSMLQAHTKRGIKEIIKIMKTSKNESLRLEAAKIILNKSVPDIKAVQLSTDGQLEAKYTVLMGNGFIPQSVASEAQQVGSQLASQSQEGIVVNDNELEKEASIGIETKS